jgi:hypothetical protein
MFNKYNQDTARMLQDLGYFPIWVEDIQEEMEIVCDVHRMGMEDEMTFMRVTDLKVTSTFERDEYGYIIRGTEHRIFRFMGVTDDGLVLPTTWGQGHSLYAKIANPAIDD